MKKRGSHLNIESRSALYTDIATLNKHYDLATKKRDLLGCLCNNPIKIVPKIKVFDRLPIASMETYLASLPCEKNTDYSDALVFYSADESITKTASVRTGQSNFT